MALQGVEQTVVHVEPLQQFVFVRVAGLLHDLGSGGKHGEECKADFCLADQHDVDAFEQDAKEPNDDAERCFVDIPKERREYVACEHLDFFAYCGGKLCLVGLIDTIFDHVKYVEVHDDHGEYGDTLFVIEVAEDTLYCSLHFRVGEDRNEGVGGCRERVDGGHDLHLTPEPCDQSRSLFIPVHVDLEWRLAGNGSYQLCSITLMYL